MIIMVFAIIVIIGKLYLQVNPFIPNAPFLYPLKRSENLTVEKAALGTNGLIG